AGLALKPGTPVEPYLEFLAEFDQILIMTVEPGFGGQSFMAETMPKLARVRQELDRWKPDIWLQVDGGIGRDTIAVAADHGADTFVAGSAVFRADSPSLEIDALRAVAAAHARSHS
ncbi:MAG: ribulose-phosphate 3-epimerase, partial [Microbacteriaceae bacterium]|nr:ribulose-phosphate 3-epimerase [Microbacteriaceae bacterium]